MRVAERNPAYSKKRKYSGIQSTVVRYRLVINIPNLKCSSSELSALTTLSNDDKCPFNTIKSCTGGADEYLLCFNKHGQYNMQVIQTGKCYMTALGT